VAVATLAVFARSLGGGFVWDDHVSVVGDRTTTADPFGYFRPLRAIDYRIDRALFGLDPLGYHAHSLLWHALAAVLLLLVLRRVLGDGRAALAAALLWAVHPAQTESVAWIASRGEVAMGACGLASVLFALRSHGFDRDLALSLVFAAAAPLYKETAFALWVVVAAVRLTGLSRAPLWPYVLVAAGVFGWRHAMLDAPFAHTTAFVLGGSTAGTFATTIRAFGFYLCEALLPAQTLDWHLSPSTSFADGAVLAWLAVHAALVAAAVVVRRRAPALTVGVAWFYAFLLPVANWPVFVGIPTAERYLYLSLVGAALAAGWVARRIGLAPLVVVVAAFAALTIDRQAMWQSDEALWAAVRADHASPRAHDHFAKGLRRRALATADRTRARRLLGDSLDEAHRALALFCAFEGTDHERNPSARPAELTASNVCHLLGRDQEALFHADEAIRIDESADELGHYDRAQALLSLGYPNDAFLAMRRALEIRPARAGAATEAFFARATERAFPAGHAAGVPLSALETNCPARRRSPDTR
jgi:hypothetical protein